MIGFPHRIANQIVRCRQPVVLRTLAHYVLLPFALLLLLAGGFAAVFVLSLLLSGGPLALWWGDLVIAGLTSPALGAPGLLLLAAATRCLDHADALTAQVRP